MLEPNKITKVLLIEPPTFPKGVKSLKLPTVAAIFESLDPIIKTEIVDLNFFGLESWPEIFKSHNNSSIVGLSVSAQNFTHAVNITKLLKNNNPQKIVIWGGEFPTLLNEICGKECDSIICGDFADVALEFWADFKKSNLQKIYKRKSESNSLLNLAPKAGFLKQYRYWNFMGDPFELTRGCIHKCSFCLVHVMQNSQITLSLKRIETALNSVTRSFLNVVDYNVAIDRAHLLKAASLIESNKTIKGWMAELCIETLQDTELLVQLSKSRLKIVYCGLESADSLALASVNKKQNKVINYEELIRKAQKHEVQIGAGLIIGLGHSSFATVKETVNRFKDLGLIYMKITFLTFNPGTKVNNSMKNVGQFISEDPTDFDGIHATFLFDGQNEQELYEQTRWAIKEFYSLKSTWYRSRHLSSQFKKRLFFILFSFCYGLSYKKWIQFQILQTGAGNFKSMLTEKFTKGFLGTLADSIIPRLLSIVFLFVLAMGSTPALATPPEWADTSLSREARIKSCATCHEGAYKAWQEGPHAEIYLKPAQREAFTSNKACYKCHNSENIFDSEKMKSLTLDKIHDKMFHRILKPDFNRDVFTGTDCLTCHVSGNQVFAGSKYKPNSKKLKAFQKNPNFCNPKPDVRVEGSCIACHAETFSYEKDLHPNMANKTCTECHSQKTGSDKVHNFFWARDYEFVGNLQKRIKSLTIFKSLNILVQNKDGKKILLFSLPNTESPHPLFTDNPREFLVIVKVPMKNGEYFEFKKVRFVSAKPEMAVPKEIIEKFPGEYVNLGGYGTKIEREFTLPDDISVSGKIQAEIYFARDSGEPIDPIKINTLSFSYKIN